MRRMLGLAIMVCACVPAFAGDIDRSVIPAGTKWVVHLDFEAMAKTRLGMAIYDSAKEEGGYQVDMIADSIGFVPLKDLHSITVFDDNYLSTSGAVLMRGRIDPDKLVGLLKNLVACREIEYNNSTIYAFAYPLYGRWDERYSAFVGDDGVVLAQSEEGIKKVLDVVNDKSLALGSEELVELDAARGQGTFIRIVGRDISMPGDTSTQAAMLQNVVAGYIEIGEQGEDLVASASLVTATEEQAEELKMFTEGLVSFARMSFSNQSNSSTPSWATMLGNIKISSKGDTVTAELKTPVENVLSLADQIVRLGALMAQP